MYETVLFDIDDTLCTYRRTAAAVLDEAFGTVGVEPYFEASAYHDRYAEFVDDTEDIDDLRRECFAAISADAGRDPDLGRAVADAFAAARDHSNVKPLPGALEAVEALSRDHRVGVVTNGAPAMQRAKLRGLGLADAFETVVHAGYDARAKPHPEPFERALAALDTPAESAIHVGNSLSSDVAGAHAAGVASAWLDAGTTPDPTPTYTLGSMADLTRPPWRSY
ncbi:HAD family hydrolase [Halosegnis marinus]|uniref:HAD family hydrolase n=1 Tax=Halosegnis marinus TaxID=3034023 RepID=A0ABD5ZKY2_9EURY|nr:HAD family hydrolase [Halosegnis sp. DT85]